MNHKNLEIALPFTENDEDEVLCNMISLNGNIHQTFVSKKMLIHYGFLEIVNEKVEQNSQDLVEATPTEYSNQDLSLHNKTNTNKNSSTNPLHSEKFKWNKSSIELLIDTRAEFDHQFYKNRNNTAIWKKIASIMNANGYVVAHSDVNDKFRNLMATYRANQDRASQSGEGAISWEYFEIMKNHFGHKDSVSPKNKQLFESSIIDKPGTSTQNVVYNSAPQLSAELKSKINKPTLKRKCISQCKSQSTSMDTNVDKDITEVGENTNDSDDSDSIILKPVRVKNKKNIPSQILDLLIEEKKETAENNKHFFNLMGRLVELEEEKLKILKSNSNKP